MELVINGTPQSVTDVVAVSDLVAALGLPDRGVAIAIDDAVVPKGTWAETALHPNQHIEILTAVQGG